MPEHPSPPPLRPGARADFSGGRLWFDGILEGPAFDADRLRAFLPRLAELGLEAADLEFEAGRFSILAADHRRSIERAAGLDHEGLRQALDELLALSSAPEACDSTLRCSEVGRDRVRETLFAVQAGEMTLITRERPLRADDVSRAEQSRASAVDPAIMHRRRFLLIGALALAGLFFVWQTKILDALLAPPADQLTIDLGPFEGLLEVEVDAPFLAYGVDIRRGPTYPPTPAAARAARDEARELSVAEATAAVTEGETIYLLVVDEKGETLTGVGVSMRGLLGGEAAQVRALVSARRGAAVLRLALSPGSGHKGM